MKLLPLVTSIGFLSVSAYLIWVLFPYKSPSEGISLVAETRMEETDVQGYPVPVATHPAEPLDAPPQSAPSAPLADPRVPLVPARVVQTPAPQTHDAGTPALGLSIHAPDPPVPSSRQTAGVTPSKDSSVVPWLLSEGRTYGANEKEIRIILSMYPNMPKKWIYPNAFPCPEVQCVLFHDQDPRMFLGFTEQNKARLHTMHIMQLYSDMANYYPKPSFYDLKTNPLKLKYMVTNYENMKSPHLAMWGGKWWVGDLYHKPKLFETFDIVSSTEAGSTIRFNYYVHYMSADGMQEALRNLLKPQLAMKTAPALASYTASHKGTTYNREMIARELMKYISVAAYGKSVNNHPVTPKGCHDQHYDPISAACIMSHHKFHLSFENSQADDYVTEKIYLPLMVGTIPVYKGAPNVDNYVPPMSIIKVDDFPTVRDLAHYLNCIARTPDLYHYYTSWRNRTSRWWESVTSAPHPLCRACQMVATDDPILHDVGHRIPRTRPLDPEAALLQKPFKQCLRSP